ncbi:uncharacterized protein TRAVEDRAFT_54721 [Trametes versicolor FP-101664 SS1]|uniref:Uncharacterized protein n=2 Tax=Trametes versicolor (strain FP-101664) TaxID=717944 RepID=R7S8H7_TRAVS|nr:uncharacterized protein TRAVEDRAFT_54721 [Trametes versicolor FP-101664 SS1]EIW51259.1 hypothetical protein TRAVEDRAFT_54721 [Trametes versicolor FP-101664 SS1]
MTRQKRPEKPAFRSLGKTIGTTYARREIAMRGEVRQGLTQKLVTRVGHRDPKVSMRWTVSGLCEDIYLKHRLKLVGWPEGVYFTDLSDVTGLARISKLMSALRSGDLTFEPISQAEYDAAKLNPLLAAPTHLNYGLTPNLGRNDIGKRRGSSKVDPERYPPHHVRDGPKSDKWVSKEAEARAELPEEPHELFKRGELYAGPRPGQLHFLN